MGRDRDGNDLVGISGATSSSGVDALPVKEQYVSVAEDNDNGRFLVELRNTPSYKITADTLVLTGSGFLQSLTFTCNDAAPTAGSIIVYDNTAESGSELHNETFTTTPFRAYNIPVNASVANGIYVGFTTTNDVNVFANYRADT